MSKDQFTAFSDRDIGQRERLEDYAADQRLTTPGGMDLQLGIVADGVGGEMDGEKASRLAVETILNYFASSRETEIPRMIVEAIRLANNAIVDQLRGMAKTTITLMVVDLNDGDYGRLFVGSVGDSKIYIARGKRLIRLNTDHTVANEKVMREEISPEQAPYVEHGSALTRALGIRKELQVDIGIYARKGENRVAPDFAHQQGLAGLALQQGDTLIASSDGLFDPDPKASNGQSYLREEEILKHAMDSDVQKATRIMMSYGNARNPADNISLSVIFVPSPKRRNTVGGISRGVLYSIVATAVTVVGIILVVFSQILSGVNEDAEATQIAAEATNSFLRTVVAYTDTPLPTSQPSATPTPRPTATPLPTATSRPTIIPGGRQIGFAYQVGQLIGAVEEDQLIINSPGIDTYIAITGNEDVQEQQANLFMDGNTSFIINDIEEIIGRQSLDIEINSDSNMFIELGSFAIGGVRTELAENSNIRFSSLGACMAVEVQDETATFSCYSAGTEDCSYDIPGSTGLIASRSKVNISLTDEQLVSDASISYDDALAYYTLLARQNVAAPLCIAGIVDGDGDNFLDQNDDTCPEQAGDLEGCPDNDEDGVPESRDDCPTTFGTGEDGCPVDSDRDGVTDNLDACPLTPGDPRNRGCPVDSDRDGVIDPRDACPTEFGRQENGCPIPAAPPGSQN